MAEKLQSMLKKPTVALSMPDWDFVLGSLILQETSINEAKRIKDEIKGQLR